MISCMLALRSVPAEAIAGPHAPTRQPTGPGCGVKTESASACMVAVSARL